MKQDSWVTQLTHSHVISRKNSNMLCFGQIPVIEVLTIQRSLYFQLPKLSLWTESKHAKFHPASICQNCNYLINKGFVVVMIQLTPICAINSKKTDLGLFTNSSFVNICILTKWRQLKPQAENRRWSLNTSVPWTWVMRTGQVQIHDSNLDKLQAKLRLLVCC